MLKKILRRTAHLAARGADIVGRLFGELATLLWSGPRAYAGFARTHRLRRSRPGSTFANGVTTALTPERARGWHKVRWKPVVVALRGAPAGDVSAWMRASHALLHCHFLVEPEVAARLVGVSPRVYSVSGVDDAPSMDLIDLWAWMHRWRRRWDLVLLDGAQRLPEPTAIVELQHAAYQYHHDDEVGFVTPAYRAGGVITSGYDVDRRTGAVVPVTSDVRDYGQWAIPRYVLTAAAHGLYATSAAIDRVDVADRHLAGLDLDQQVGKLVRQGWAGHFRTLCFSSTVLDVDHVPAVTIDGEQERWLVERVVSTPDGTPRVVFVLNATSVSGGIRIVFEQANGLARRGFDVEIWTLQDAPTWFDLHVPVRTYRNYDDLLLSLRNVDAIKVATWWETAEIVWLASVNHGVPAYLIQEFETWFYPDDPVAQAAVVASYRHEFASVTEAGYQRSELAEVGVQAALVPNGYDPDVFHPVPGAERDADTILALGRSFFQKNFAMTERAWRSLGADRPLLLMFGTEPGIVDDLRAEYHERPRDAQVNELYNRATVFIQTSRHEGFCLPILEAMAAGCPVIATDSHGNRDFCVDGVNCLIVEQDDDVALARAIRRLLADPAERDRLARAGLETASRYPWPLVLDEVAAFHRGLVERAQPDDPSAAPAEHVTGGAVHRSER